MRSASPRCGNATTTRWPVRMSAASSHLRLGEAARRDRRLLRLEGERLVLRERIELGRAVERRRLDAVLLPDAAHRVRLEDEVGRAGKRRHEVVRHSIGVSSPSSD